jgi:HK97 family phage prohead protease
VDIGARVEYRASDDGTPRLGMFVPFNSDSLDLGGFTEQIAPGAFARTIKNGARSRGNGDIIALWNHDPLWVLGRQANDTLELRESGEGLEGLVALDATDGMHQHFAARVKRGDVQGSSFGFQTVKDEWEHHDDGTIHRTLLEVKLFDVSPVTFPAYPASDAEARAAAIRPAAVTLARAGMDLGELADVLTSAGAHTQVPQDRAAELQDWVARLQGFVPAAPVPERDWELILTLRERRLGIRREA